MPPEIEQSTHIQPPPLPDINSYPTGQRLARELGIGESGVPMQHRTSILNQLGERGVSSLKGTPSPSSDVYGDLQY